MPTDKNEPPPGPIGPDMVRDDHDRLRRENAALRRLMDASGHWEGQDAWGQAEAARLLHNAYVDALYATGMAGRMTGGED